MVVGALALGHRAPRVLDVAIDLPITSRKVLRLLAHLVQREIDIGALVQVLIDVGVLPALVEGHVARAGAPVHELVGLRVVVVALAHRIRASSSSSSSIVPHFAQPALVYLIKNRFALAVVLGQPEELIGGLLLRGVHVHGEAPVLGQLALHVAACLVQNGQVVRTALKLHVAEALLVDGEGARALHDAEHDLRLRAGVALVALVEVTQVVVPHLLGRKVDESDAAVRHLERFLGVVLAHAVGQLVHMILGGDAARVFVRPSGVHPVPIALADGTPAAFLHSGVNRLLHRIGGELDQALIPDAASRVHGIVVHVLIGRGHAHFLDIEVIRIKVADGNLELLVPGVRVGEHHRGDKIALRVARFGRAVGVFGSGAHVVLGVDVHHAVQTVLGVRAVDPLLHHGDDARLAGAHGVGDGGRARDGIVGALLMPAVVLLDHKVLVAVAVGRVLGQVLEVQMVDVRLLRGGLGVARRHLGDDGSQHRGRIVHFAIERGRTDLHAVAVDMHRHLGTCGHAGKVGLNLRHVVYVVRILLPELVNMLISVVCKRVDDNAVLVHRGGEVQGFSAGSIAGHVVGHLEGQLEAGGAVRVALEVRGLAALGDVRFHPTVFKLVALAVVSGEATGMRSR